MDGIQIYELKRMDLRGATVIDGFPSVAASGLQAWDLLGDRSLLAVDLPGHMPGHLGLLFTSGGRQVLLVGDADHRLDQEPPILAVPAVDPRPRALKSARSGFAIFRVGSGDRRHHLQHGALMQKETTSDN